MPASQRTPTPPPTLSLSGTDAATLEDGWRKIHAAAEALSDAIYAAEINQRDYPDDDAWRAVCERRHGWGSVCADIAVDSSRIIGSIMDQRDLRGGRR